MSDWSDGPVRLMLGDCRERLRELADGSVDALVTDPPYELDFMGQAWDRGGVAFDPAMWAETLRVAKPGAYLLSFGGTRTYHRMACAIEDAGWEVRDMIEWIYGSGFPKNAKVALKPAHEPICMARKPFRGSVAANVLAHGTGVLNINGCRVEGLAEMPGSQGAGDHLYGSGKGLRSEPSQYERHPAGRWPANLVLSHAEDCVPVGTRRVRGSAPISGNETSRPTSAAFEGRYRRIAVESYAGADGMEAIEAWECVEGCAVAELDRQSGDRPGMGAGRPLRRGVTTGAGMGYGSSSPQMSEFEGYGDTGGASRFFYVAKASGFERSAGLPPGARNTHPTVKPIALMRWLCRLVTPPGGLVLDPFAGSGTTLVAAVLEGFDAIGIEQDAESVGTAIARLSHWRHQPDLLEAPLA